MYFDIFYLNLEADTQFHVYVANENVQSQPIGELWESIGLTNVVQNYQAVYFQISSIVSLTDDKYTLLPTDYITTEILNLGKVSMGVYTKKRVKPVQHYFLIDTPAITDIADAIREKTGVTTDITPNQFVNYLENL